MEWLKFWKWFSKEEPSTFPYPTNDFAAISAMSADRYINVKLSLGVEERRQQIQKRFVDELGHTGWKTEFSLTEKGYDNDRVLEKEQDAARVASKALVNIESMLINTTLLSLSNEDLMELLNKTTSFCLELDAEARRRE